MNTQPAEWLDRARRFFVKGLWTSELRPRSLPAAALRSLQLVVVIARGFVEDKLLLRASALTYITALAIVPILVIVFSVIKTLGLSRDLAVLAVERFAAGSPEAVTRIMGVVENANVGALGSIGGAIFLVTTILSLRHVEETLNEIWGARGERSWVRRFTNYLAVLVLTPLLLGTAISLIATLRNAELVEAILAWPLLAGLSQFALEAAPTLFLVAGFAVIYKLLPNTSVNLGSALLGGLVAGLLFTLAQHLYVGFSVGAARYNALFGGVAFLPLLLVWIYFSWSIMLFGAEISYAHQNLAHYRQEARSGSMGSAEREALGLRVVVTAARAFRDGEGAQGSDVLAEQLGAPFRAVSELLHQLEDARIVSSVVDEHGDEGFQLARPAETIAIAGVLAALRGPVSPRQSGSRPVDRVVETLLDDAQAALEPVVGERTLADLLEQVPARQA